MNIKRKLQMIESELTVLSGDVFLLNQKMPNDIIPRFREKVLMPIKSLLALCENIEKEIYEESAVLRP